MINKIILFSIRNKLIVGLLTLAMIGVGIYSMSTVNLGSVPDITNNQIQVITVSPNLATEDIEQFVTYPIEMSMGNLPGVEEIRSISRFGLSVVTIIFEDRLGTYLPRQLVQEKLNELQESIPQKFGSPMMGPISTGLGQIYEYTIQPQPGYDSLYTAMDLRTIQDWIVKRQLTLLDGVVEVNSFGGYIKQYEVALNPDKLKAMSISISEVFRAIEQNNLNTGGAYIERNHMATFIRGEGLVRSLSDIRKIVIRNENGLPITIGDVAERVHYGYSVRYGSFSRDGREAVGGIIMMLKGSNPNRVINNVKSRIQEIQKTLPEGLKIDAYLDRSNLIARTTSTVKKNLMEGALIVVFVLVILLGSLRGGILTATVIPLSLLFAFILMKFTGVWANLMSLGAIDFGIIVDGAVIIVEGTVHEIEKQIKKGRNRFTQNSMNEMAYKAGSTMMNSAFFGQLIILIVFSPILFLTGVEGKMFRPMAFTFGYAVLGAIFLSLTYVPMMASLMLRPIANKRNLFARFEHGIARFSQKLIAGIQRVYRPLLNGALRIRAIVILLSLLLLGSSLYTFSHMGGEFIPQLDEGDLAMQALIRPGSSLTEATEISKQIERFLLDHFPEIVTVTSHVGVADIPTDPMPMDIADMYIILEKDKSKWVSAESKDELIEKINESLNREFTGINLVFTQPVELRFNELLEGVREDIAVKLYGEDLDILEEKKSEMERIIRTVPGVGDVNSERTSGLQQITITYNRNKVAQYGLNIEKLNEYVSTAFAGGKAGVVFEGEKRFDIVVRFDKAHHQSIEDIKLLYVDLPDGTQIPIKEVADIRFVSGPMQISRENTFRRTYVGINTRGRDIESVILDIEQKLDASLELPPGYYITYGGAFENLQRAKKRLGLVVPIALALIFILLYFALKSLKQSLMIYMAIPLAAIGGIFFLSIRGMPFSISAGVGFVVLFGVAVLNGLVLISRFNSLKQEGITNLRERIFIATEERLRPILLTAVAAIMGFIPMAFSQSAGAEVQRPLATVVIGGLISATLLTLIVLPVLYYLVESRDKQHGSGPDLRQGAALLIILLSGLFFGSDIRAQSPLAQPLTLEQSKSRALQRYPNIEMARLEVERQKALRRTAWQMGSTGLYTGKEEVDQGSAAIYNTIGIQQQGMAPFAIGPGLKLRDAQTALAGESLGLQTLSLSLRVSNAWSDVYTSREVYRVFTALDSMFSGIREAAEIRYQTEAISKLEYLATINEANEVQNRKEQAYRDYLSALQRFNRWFDSDTLYTVASEAVDELARPLLLLPDSIRQHPLLKRSEQEMAVARARLRVNKAQYLPQLSGQYNRQIVDGQGGFYLYQLGISIPLFYGPTAGRVKAAGVNVRIKEEQYRQTRIELESGYFSVREQYLKWLDSWTYYRDHALPLAREQRKAAMTAYREGQIDYTGFLQSIRFAMRMESEAWTVLNRYLKSRFQLEYFLSNNY